MSPQTQAQWTNSRTAMDKLNGVVPYAIAPGNHDYGGQGNDRTTLFDNGVAGQNYYGLGSPYAVQPSIGGFFETGKTDNSWHTFSANGKNWLVLALEWGPRDAVVQWADQVVTDHPDYETMVVTHAYMYNDDTIYDWATKGSSQSWNPHSYGIESLPGGVNDGEELWDKFIKKHENIDFVFNGHVLGDGTGKRATLGDNGNVVHQILANYQFNVQGGQGDMPRIGIQAGRRHRGRAHLFACARSIQHGGRPAVHAPNEQHDYRRAAADRACRGWELNRGWAHGPLREYC